MDALVTVTASTVLGGAAGWVGSLLRFRQSRHAKSGDDAAAAIRQAMVELGQLRSLYQDAAMSPRRGRPSDRALAAQENDLLSACDSSAVEELADAVHAYLVVGRAYASGDPDAGSVQEEAARDALSALMRRLVRAAQSP